MRSVAREDSVVSLQLLQHVLGKLPSELRGFACFTTYGALQHSTAVPGDGTEESEFAVSCNGSESANRQTVGLNRLLEGALG